MLLDPSKPQILGLQEENFEAFSLDNDINLRSFPPAVMSPAYSRSKSNLDQVYSNKNVKQDRENLLNANKPRISSVVNKLSLHRQSSYKENSSNSPRNYIKHSNSDANINKNTNITSKMLNKKNLLVNTNNSLPNISKPQNVDMKQIVKPMPVKAIPIIMDSTAYSIKNSVDESPVSDEYLHLELDKPAGLALEEFLPVSKTGN